MLATVDWLLVTGKCEASATGLREGLRKWPDGKATAERKSRVFDDRALRIALNRLAPDALASSTQAYNSRSEH